MEAIRTEDEKLQKVYGCYVCFPSANAHTGHAIGEEVCLSKLKKKIKKVILKMILNSRNLTSVTTKTYPIS